MRLTCGKRNAIVWRAKWRCTVVDIVVNPVNVLPGAGAQYVQGIAAASLTAGLVCCVDTTGNYVRASAAAEDTATIKGISTHPSSPGLIVAGTLDVGAAVLTIGRVYYLSTNLGGITVEGDLEGRQLYQSNGRRDERLLQLRLWSTGVVRS